MDERSPVAGVLLDLFHRSVIRRRFRTPMRAAYYEQLDQINDDLVEMTRLVGSAMNRATQALLDADLSLAEAVIDFRVQSAIGV